jgi:hypothetical protein
MSNVTSYILLVQLYANGDCLYATTLARQIKHDYPGCHLTWAISPSCKSIIDLNPYVDAVRLVPEVPKNDEKAFRKFRTSASILSTTNETNEYLCKDNNNLKGRVFTQIDFKVGDTIWLNNSNSN